LQYHEGIERIMINNILRGYCASMLYDGVASMTYFSTYELTKYQLFPYFKSGKLLVINSRDSNNNNNNNK
jgi:hypothetical protein